LWARSSLGLCGIATETSCKRHLTIRCTRRRTHLSRRLHSQPPRQMLALI
jgi:hypothetical protein